MKAIIAALFLSLAAGLAFAAPLPALIDEPALVRLLEDRSSTFLLLDVRTAEEYAEGHIPGALLMPYDELRAKFREPDKNRPIVVYCRSGRRSAIAADTLRAMGYASVADFGAVTKWRGKLETH